MYLDGRANPSEVDTTDSENVFLKQLWSAFLLQEPTEAPEASTDTGTTDTIMPSNKMTHETWRRLIEASSRLSLTQEEDKLPALSGIAKVMQQKGAGTYLAGLWSGDLAADLLWAAGGKRTKLWRAPSWSWASVEGGLIKFTKSRASGIDKTYAIEIVDATCTAAGRDPTGEVADGSVTIKGMMVECLLGRSVTESWEDWHERAIFRGEMRSWAYLDGANGQDIGDKDVGMTVYTLLMHRRLEDLNSNDATPWHALLLRKSRGIGGKAPVQDAYERIGSVQSDWMVSTRRMHNTTWQKWFKDAPTMTVTIV
jgi:hypothetical protein